MIYAFSFFAAALLFLSYRSLRGGIDYLDFFKSELAKPESNYTPFASVIVPCRGLDQDLNDNLSALLRQDYLEYEVVFVVDDEKDAAVAIIEEVSRLDRKTVKKIRLIVAKKTTESSQKVENLREAVMHVSANSQVFVFADSDARPGENWLRDLIAPLENEAIGAATGYRWFISKESSFASEMLSVWNASIASALGKNTKTNFCWGGSMAIRRDTFERLDIREKWHGTLSDDFAVTRAMNEAELPIYSVPRAFVASVEDCTLRELFEFTNRQMKITRVYAPKLWILSLVGSGLFNLVLLWAIAIILSSSSRLNVGLATVVITLVSLFSISKGWLRLQAVRLILTDYEDELDRQFWPQNTFWLFAPALFFINAINAWASRKMTWRGITYELKSPTETVIIAE